MDEHKQFFVIPVGDKGQPMVVKLMVKEIGKSLGACIDNKWVSVKHPKGFTFVTNAKHFLTTTLYQLELEYAFKHYEGMVNSSGFIFWLTNELSRNDDRLILHNIDMRGLHSDNDQFKLHDFGMRGSKSDIYDNHLGWGTSELFLTELGNSLMMENCDNFKHDPQRVENNNRGETMNLRNIDINALGKVADKNITKDLKKYGAVQAVGVRASLEKKLNEQRAELEDEAAESIMNTIKCADSTIEKHVLELRELRKKENEIKKTLSALNNAKDFGMNDKSEHPNFLPLAKLIGVPISDEYRELADVVVPPVEAEGESKLRE